MVHDITTTLLGIAKDANALLKARSELPDHHVTSLRTIRKLCIRNLATWGQRYPAFDYAKFQVCQLGF